MRSGLFLALAYLSGLMANQARADFVYSLNFDTDLQGRAIAANTKVADDYPISGVTFSSNFVVLRGFTIPSLPNEAGPSDDFHNSPVEIDFANVVNFVSAIDVTFSRFTLTAYNSSGGVVASSSVTDLNQVALVSASGISKVIFTGNADPNTGITQYGLDNLQFGSVPEPSSLALTVIASAFVLGGWVARRRSGILMTPVE